MIFHQHNFKKIRQAIKSKAAQWTALSYMQLFSFLIKQHLYQLNIAGMYKICKIAAYTKT